MNATSNGHDLRTWDDGFGKIWVYFETLGPLGVVRAETFEDAWSCVVDEIMDGADPEDPDTYARSYDDSADEGELAECHHWRGSGIPSNDMPIKSAIAHEDPNGSYLVPLSDELCKLWNIEVSMDDAEIEVQQ